MPTANGRNLSDIPNTACVAFTRAPWHDEEVTSSSRVPHPGRMSKSRVPRFRVTSSVNFPMNPQFQTDTVPRIGVK